MTRLSDLINSALVDRGMSGMSSRELSQATHRRLSHDSLNKYRNGTHGTPDESTLHILATLLALPIDELRTAAGLPPGALGAYEPPVESARLSPRQRAAITELIRSMVSSDRDIEASRRRELIERYLSDPASDPELITRLEEMGFRYAGKAPRRGTLAREVWDARRAMLERELNELPPRE